MMAIVSLCIYICMHTLDFVESNRQGIFSTMCFLSSVQMQELFINVRKCFQLDNHQKLR